MKDRLCLFNAFLLIYPILLLLPTIAFTLESGDTYIGLFGGYKKGAFSDTDHLTFFGVTNRTYQPTLNWGDHRAEFIGFFQDNSREELKLGYLGLDVDDLWLYPGIQADAFLGDGFMRFVTPTLVFEHFAVPGQSLRGGGIDVTTGWGRAGLQAGKVTEGDFQVPGAVSTLNENLAGAFLEWRGPFDSRLAGAVDFLDIDNDHRLLSTLYGTLPIQNWELRLAGWYDSKSSQTAAIAGIRRPLDRTYTEAGLLHVPENFHYLGESANLPQGETLLFGTYRSDGVRMGYFFESSGGQLENGEDTSLLINGSLGGYYRILIRDTVSSGLNFSYRDSDDESIQARLQESIRYTRNRSRWDGSVLLEAIQLEEKYLDGKQLTTEKTYRWISELAGNYRKTNWDAGAKLVIEHENMNDNSDQTFTQIRLDGRGTAGYGISGGAFVQVGMTWGEGDRTETYGGGFDATFPLPRGFQFRTRLRAQRNELSSDTDPLFGDTSDSGETSIDFFATIEHRVFWGQPEPVIGLFKGPKPAGTGEIQGRVFVDMNENGFYDPGDKALSGVVVRLDEGFLLDTDAHGLYRFPSVAAGPHNLSLDQASFPIEYVDPWADGLSIQIYPRDRREKDWPLKRLHK